MFANIIFPAPSAAYVASIFFPLAALLAILSEIGVFIYFQEGSLLLICVSVVIANVFSWISGLVLSGFLPSGLVPHLGTGPDGRQFTVLLQGPHWDLIALLSFVWACLLSSALEYGFFALIRRWVKLKNPFRCVLLANIVSYIIISCIALASLLHA